MNRAVDVVLRCYPRIYFACHVRHVRDARTGNLLSAHQAAVLDHLDDVEPTTMAELAKHMGVTASTMSLSVDRLERDGYVSRTRSAVDARRLELRLTEAGVAIKKQQKVLEPELIAEMLGRLTGPERKRALEGLELLARAASEMVAEKKHRGGGA